MAFLFGFPTYGMPPTDSETLYKINIQTPASPDELARFCELLESEGYTVATDLHKGRLEVRPGLLEQCDDEAEDPHADYKATTQ